MLMTALIVLMILPAVNAALTDGLVVWLKMDNSSGTNETDYANSKLFTQQGTVSSTTGIISDSRGTYTTSNNFIRVADTDLDFNSSQAYSVSMWVKFTGTPGDEALLCFNDVSAQNNFWLDCMMYYSTDSSLSVLTVKTGDAGDFCSAAPFSINTSKWYHLVHTWSGSGGNKSLYMDNKQVSSCTHLPNPNNPPVGVSIGFRDFDNIWGASHFYIDEVAIYNRSISTTEITQLYNTGSGTTYPFTIETISLSLILYDTSFGKITQLDNFQSFYPAANYSNQTDPKQGAVCNMTGYNISTNFLHPYKANYTLNTSSDYISFNVTEGTTNLLYDTIRFSVCDNSPTTDVSIYLNGTLFRTVSSSVIPSCSSGKHTEVNITRSLLSNTSYNLRLQCNTCDITGSKYMRFIMINDSILSASRKFSSYTEDLTYNTSLGVYTFVTHPYMYDDTTGNITLKCDNSTVNQGFNVTNNPPTIVITEINNYTYAPNILIERQYNNTIIAEIDTEIITYIQFNLSYSNGTIINSSLNTESLYFQGSAVNTTGIYNISIVAVDNDGQYNLTKGFFRVNDTSFPEVTHIFPLLSNTSEMTQNVSTLFQMDFNDEVLFAYNVTLTRPDNTLAINWTKTGLNIPTYLFREYYSPDSVGIWTLNVTLADAHTANEIKDLRTGLKGTTLTFYTDKYKKNKLEKTDEVNITYMEDYGTREIKAIKDGDRYKFYYEFFMDNKDLNAEYNRHRFKVQCDELYYIEDSPWPGHFVCWNTMQWIDFNTSSLISYTVDDCGDGCYMIDMKTKSGSNNLTFESIGGLNNVTGSLTFDVVAPSTSVILGFTTCPSGVEGKMLLAIVLVVIMFLYYISFKFNVILVEFMTSLSFAFFSAILYNCAEMLGIIIGIVAVMFVAVSFVRMMVKLFE